MKIEEAIVYVLTKRNGGMTTDQIAEAINRFGLHIRKKYLQGIILIIVGQSL